MKLPELLDSYVQDPWLKAWTSSLPEGGRTYSALGLAGGLTSLVGAAVYKLTGRNVLFLLPDKEEAAYFLNDLEKMLGEQDVLFFPGSYRRPYQIEETDNANVLLRAEVLNRLQERQQPAAIVTFPDALFEQVVTRQALASNTLGLTEGEKISIDFLNETLFAYHFERVDFVTEPGQFSIRGGIVDVFSFSNDNPYRIEFFGDEIDSIRSFDTVSQLSIDRVKQIRILANVENKLIREKRQSFLEYLDPSTLLFTPQLAPAAKRLDTLFEKAEEAFKGLNEDIRHSRPEELFINGDRFLVLSEPFTTIETASGNQRTGEDIQFHSAPQPSFNKQFELLVEDLKQKQEEGYRTHLLCASPQQAERFYSIFEDLGTEVKFQPILGALHQGFIDHTKKIACYTDHQIFERYQRFRLKNGLEKRQAITLKELTSLQYGDYVTHIDHGVGQFAGLQKIEVSGKMQEAIKLIYRDSDVLYLSIHSLHKISRYNSKEGTAPSLHKLGSAQWQKLKQKTKTRVKQMAYDLLQLYAKRRASRGFAFHKDTYLQHELEASFLYEDTPDQVKATADVKADMENEIPMDRLICGDVGFGKTEIAIRAAFKAATDGKQVAVLVPTTVLAFQHFKTFSDRLKDFPVRVDYINRFRSSAVQREVLKDLETGKVDILIGTHKLVSKEVKFKDLGLLIIDEEQKFGVAVKDKLKTLRVNVDTLTLTATPIPRTLQFSLMQARDLSVMTTPPPNRHPIDTQVIGFNEETIRDAIRYELQRSGQVIFIHNRVENIHEVAGMIQRLVPDARIGVGHGQMDGKKLEDLMLGFMEGDFDILVSTTIVENGLDVPNANTILIHNAQNFGLAELHQMRGRVGRSNKKAFCKLIAPPYVSLTEEARKRLQAIEQFSDLGSGFQIAMRDLEIRGAGDLLGADQSGFINDMGFETYQKILAEAIEELKETEFKELYESDLRNKEHVKECQIDTDLELLIPDDYVNITEERLRLYRTLDDLDTEEQLLQFEQELNDRFGPLPEQVQELLKSMRLRWVGKELGFEKLVLKQGKMIGYFVANPQSDYFQSEVFGRLLEHLKHHPEASMKERNGKLSMTFAGVSNVSKALQALSKLSASQTATA